MSASCWNASFPYGGNYQCTVNVSSNAGSALGNITYSYDGGTPVSVPLSSGSAGFTITKPPVGNQSVVIGYAQQTNYAAATPQTENFTVTAAPVQVSLTPSTWYTTVGTNITFSAAATSWSAGPPNDNGAVPSTTARRFWRRFPSTAAARPAMRHRRCGQARIPSPQLMQEEPTTHPGRAA